jgi:hypothetical protein
MFELAAYHDKTAAGTLTVGAGAVARLLVPCATPNSQWVLPSSSTTGVLIGGLSGL